MDIKKEKKNAINIKITKKTTISIKKNKRNKINNAALEGNTDREAEKTADGLQEQ